MEHPKVFSPASSKYLVFTADYLLPTFISLGVILLGYFVLYSSFFKISTITCSTDYQECANPSVIAELDKLKGQNIFTLKISEISEKLTSGDFTIREVVLTKQLPGIIKLDLQSVYPVVALQVIGDPTWVVMDSNFRVIGTRDSEPNVPTVIVQSPLSLVVGKVPDDELIKGTLALARRLADELFSVKTITLIDADTIELALSSGVKAIFTPKKDELVQLRSLQVILSDATIMTGVKTIDVRFGRPVLR